MVQKKTALCILCTTRQTEAGELCLLAWESGGCPGFFMEKLKYTGCTFK